MEYLKNHVRLHSFSMILDYSESLFQISHTSRCYSISESEAAPHDFVFVNKPYRICEPAKRTLQAFLNATIRQKSGGKVENQKIHSHRVMLYCFKCCFTAS